VIAGVIFNPTHLQTPNLGRLQPGLGEERIKMKKYKGTFCWHGEDHILYTLAINQKKAFRNFCSQLAKKLERSASSVANYFIGTDKYNVEEVN